MCATWNFSAPPEPTTASFTARGAYSNTGTAAGTAHSAAPRACPSLSALSALRLTNTRSTATSVGWCSETSACRPSKRIRSRAVGAAAATFRQPCATTVSLPRQQSITPKPVRREPGSSPSTRTLSSAAIRAAVGSNARQDLVRYLDIRINVPYLVQPLERIQQLHHRHGLLARQHDRRRGALRDLGGRGLEATVREDRPHGVELERIRQHFHRGVAVRHDVLGAGLERRLHEPLLVRAGRVGHQAHGIEQIAHRAVGSEPPPVLQERAAHRCARTAAIFRHALDHHCGAAGAVPLVAHTLRPPPAPPPPPPSPPRPLAAGPRRVIAHLLGSCLAW